MENEEDFSDILTFDEIIADPYYKAEFDKKVAEALNIKNSHPDVKGGNETMDGNDQTKPQGEVKTQETTANEAASQLPEATPAAADNPAAEKTETDEQKETKSEPTREMTAEQFEQYNETLRRVSKTAKASLPGRYNAFEDMEVKAIVKQRVMAGETPDIKEIAASVVTRLTQKPETVTEKTDQPKGDTNAEMLSLKVENAMLKAGIAPERLDAATKLFLAEGGDLAKVADFVAKYPEWQKESGVAFTQAPPVGGKTAPTPVSKPILTDFEKKVQAARKARGLE